MSLWDDIKSNFDFEKFQLEDWWDQIKEDPERIFIGAIDPISSDVWGAVTGKDYEPMINQWGGATNKRFVRAQEEGIDVEPAMYMHDTAKSIAKSYAAAWAGGVGADYAGSKGASPEAQMGIEQGISQIGGAMLDPQPPSETDPDLDPLKYPDQKKAQQYAATFGRESAIAEPLYIPGTGMVDPRTYQQIQPTFGRV